MSLERGTRLGPYEIVAPLGAGGMGEVYRARDTKLGREVALKVLPETLAGDPERIARFEREAKTLATLNHPNIAHIHGIEDSSGTPALVMELVEGPTLADRIATGPIPLDEALPIAMQIAEALEAAHDQGIIHRDLKPANIKVRPDGAVKVLDFGLAKALDPASSPAVGATLSPTITSPAMTQMGVILGTAAYMSPEQAKGRPADRRSDVWAFGCVLYEMLTAKRAFAARDVSDTLANVLKLDPDWTPLPRETPVSIRRVLGRCLEKDRSRRLADIADVRLEIDDAATAAGHQHDSSRVRHDLAWTGNLPWAISAMLALALAIGWLEWPSPPGPGPATHLELNLPDGVELFAPTAPAIAISPDGAGVAFVGLRAGIRQLYIRRLDEPHAISVRGLLPSTGVLFFSPAGDAIGLIQSNGTVAKVTLADNLFVPLARDADYTVGATWSADGRIVFVRNHTLWQVPVSGGPATSLLALDDAKGEVGHAWPKAISGTDAILFASITGARHDAYIEALSLRTGKRQVVVAGTVPIETARGHLVFFRDHALFEAPFDANRLAVTGSATQVIDDVAVAPYGGPLATASRTGTLVYAPAAAVKNRLVWVTRQGLEQPVTEDERDYAVPRLAPDGRRIAVEAGGQLWVYDTQRATFTRITSDDTSVVLYPVWTPDGKRVVFNAGADGLQWVDTDGAGRAHAIPETFLADFPTSISPDGGTLAFMRTSTGTDWDIYTLSLGGEPKPRPLLNTPAYEGGADISSDGRWLAYSSDDSGQMQVYVRPVGGSDRRWPVSTHSGRSPKWSRSGRELFYLDGQKMMVVNMTGGADLALSAPVLLFDRTYVFGPTLTIANYDVTSDGQRFLMVKSAAGSGRLHVMFNWLDELRLHGLK